MAKLKEVNFYKYCESCRNYCKEEYEDPCDICLGHAYNYDSEKPRFYEKNKHKNPNSRNIFIPYNEARSSFKGV